MKNLYTFIMLIALGSFVGCNKINRVMGTEKKDPVDAAQSSGVLHTIACCFDYNPPGVESWPSFLPAAHVAMCKNAMLSCRNNDCHLMGGNDIYLPMNVDCGHGHQQIGDQYYPATGY